MTGWFVVGLLSNCMARVLNSSYSPPDEWLKADQTKPGTSVSTMQSGAGKRRGKGRGGGRKGESRPSGQNLMSVPPLAL